MSETEVPAPEKPKGKLAKLIVPLLAVVCAGAGFAVTYLDLIPMSGHEAAEEHEEVHSDVEFVDVPRIQIPLPGTRDRTVSLSTSIETTAASRSEVEHLMPRIQDVITSFLSNIDADAYDKRGILEIIRAELLGRTRMVLGEEHMKDLLITEFLIK